MYDFAPISLQRAERIGSVLDFDPSDNAEVAQVVAYQRQQRRQLIQRQLLFTQAALDFLRAGGKGRAGFAPISLQRAERIGSVLDFDPSDNAEVAQVVERVTSASSVGSSSSGNCCSRRPRWIFFAPAAKVEPVSHQPAAR
jgi:DNA primase